MKANVVMLDADRGNCASDDQSASNIEQEPQPSPVPHKTKNVQKRRWNDPQPNEWKQQWHWQLLDGEWKQRRTKGKTN